MKMISLAFQTDKRQSEYGPLAAVAEEYGFDAASVYNDLLYQPAWLPLLEMARATGRILVGPSAVNPFTSHPINIAGNIAFIDDASGGRAYLGLVRGAWLDYVGLEPRKPVTAMREAIECTRHLLARTKTPYRGRVFSLQGGDTLRWTPPRTEIPILLGSWGLRTIRASLPYLWAVKLGGTVSPAAARFYRDWLAAESHLLGRSEEVLLVSGAVTVVDEDGRAARRKARLEVAQYLPVIARVDPTLEVDPELIRRIERAAGSFDFEKAAGLISDDLLQIFAFAGTPDQVIDQALGMFDAGVAWVEFGTPHGLSEAEGLRLLGSRVLPALRVEGKEFEGPAAQAAGGLV